MGENGVADNQETAEGSQGGAAEEALAYEIAALWSAQRDHAAAVRRTRQELKALRRDLGQRLHAMKSLLAQTGRAGRWASYPREHQIPRATADRLVQRHEDSLTPVHEKRLTGAISLSPEQQAEAYFQELRPRLLKMLTTQEAAFNFVCEMVCGLPGVSGDVTDEAALIFRPAACGSCEAPAVRQEPLVPVTD